MLVRADQLADLTKARRASFEQRLEGHLRGLFPHHFEPLSAEETARVIDAGIVRAKSHGLITEIGVARFIELRCYFGAEFDTDPQTAAWASPVLTGGSSGAEAARMQFLYDEGLRRWQRQAGPGNAHLKAALGRLRSADPVRWLKAALSPSPQTGLIALFEEVYPEKMAALGPATARAAIQLGLTRAGSEGFASQPGQTLYAGLALALGSGFAADPLHAWAGRAVGAPKDAADEKTRVMKLLEAAREFLGRWTSGAAATS